MVQRYTESLRGGVTESVSGDWVAYEDYQKLEAELLKLRQQVGALINDVKSRYPGGRINMRALEKTLLGGVKPAVDDGWITWAGVGKPDIGWRAVAVKLRNGRIEAVSTDLMEWRHCGSELDIVAYRMLPVT